MKSLSSFPKVTKMASASQSNSSHHIRSVSLPCRSNPNIVGIEEEEELNKLKTQELSNPPTAATICNGLSRLEGLYKCIDDLLNLPLTQQALFHHQQEKCVDELLDVSGRLLDICSTIRDFLSQIKEHVIDLQSAIRRRRKGDLSIGISIAKFTSSRKKMKKEARRLIADLKQVDNKILCSSILDLDHHLPAVIRVVREVSTRSITVFQSLLLFLSSPVSNSKPTKWSLVSKLINKGTSACDQEQLENMNELEIVDSALCTPCVYDSCEGDKMEMALKRSRLEVLHAGIEFIETGIECIFRQMIRTRASLLNIISHL